MGSNESEKTQILLVTLPYQGHINPMLKFAQHLSKFNGIQCTLATTDQARDRFSKAGAKIATQQIDLAFFSDGLTDNENRTEGYILESLRQNGHKNLIETIKNSEKSFSCIISSPFTPWVTSVALSLNIPCAILWIQACGAYSIYYRYFMKTNPFPDLEDLNLTVEIPALPLLEVRDLPSLLLPSSSAHFSKLMAEFADCLKNVKWILANSFYELESEIIESMTDLKEIIPIGPLVSPILLTDREEKIGENENEIENLDLWKSDDECINWLDKQEKSSVIYISFGSITKFTENQSKSITMALKKKKVKFLWVIRPIERFQNDVVLQELVKEGKGFVIEWGPQEKILSHVAISCFMSHCGWNSTLETITAGVPVIGYPDWTDQPIDARLICDVFGIGVRMRNDVVDGELKVSEVERCIEAVMEGNDAVEMKKKAMELKFAARKAMESGGSSMRNLESFISQISEV